MEPLQPYLEKGTLTIPSGYIAFEDTCIPDQDPEAATKLLKRHLSDNYKRNQFPDIICTVSQSVADACIAFLEEKGCPEENWPLITVMEGTSSPHWESGKISFSVQRYMQQLNEQVFTMTEDLFTGNIPEITDNLKYFNNVTVVPTYVCGFETQLPPEPAPEETTEATTEPA